MRRKLRPCLGSYLEFDIMKPMRRASDEELKRFSWMWSIENRSSTTFETIISQTAG
ncbi:MAG: hypothetical protein Udaeo2_04390 [Candidatus Udaeobacter sp.]|nr:MAG: hypothetical protein Udaeo2_04390 [Candidatus Udaeobacter sp.]